MGDCRGKQGEGGLRPLGGGGQILEVRAGIRDAGSGGEREVSPGGGFVEPLSAMCDLTNPGEAVMFCAWQTKQKSTSRLRPSTASRIASLWRTLKEEWSIWISSSRTPTPVRSTRSHASSSILTSPPLSRSNCPACRSTIDSVVVYSVKRSDLIGRKGR